VGSGLQVSACATFAPKSNLALALSNKICKFLNIPELKEENSSGSQRFVLGWSDASAIDFIPSPASRKLYMLAYICNHPQPNSVSRSCLPGCLFLLAIFVVTVCAAVLHQCSGISYSKPKRSLQQ
jgi:hypothetical protein